MAEIEKNGKRYLSGDGGYYGVLVTPGGHDDNTGGKIGIHWEYLQYARGPLADEIRAALPDLQAQAERELERERTARADWAAQRDNEDARMRASGLCPECGTWCYGDCRS